MNALVFNVFVVTTLEFVAQLRLPPQEVEQAILRATRRLAPGPGSWCTHADLENLKQFGFSIEFRTLDKTAKAAKLRVVHQLLPDLFKLYIELQSLHARNTRRPFGPWHTRSFVAILRDNLMELRLLDISITKLASLPSPKGFQAAVRQELCKKYCIYRIEHRIRHKLKRWILRILPGHIAPRCLRSLAIVASHCKPRVLPIASPNYGSYAQLTRR